MVHRMYFVTKVELGVEIALTMAAASPVAINPVLVERLQGYSVQRVKTPKLSIPIALNTTMGFSFKD